MPITKACKAAMIEHGVLTKDGVPAAAHLMNKDTLRIALIEPDENGVFPENLDMGDFKQVIESAMQHKETFEILSGQDTVGPGKFPPNIQDIVRQAIGFWYAGNIEFVALEDHPDINIGAFNLGNSDGFATPPPTDSLPVIDDIDLSVVKLPEIPLMIISTKYDSDDNKTPTAAMVDSMRHEFGHTFAIRHPFDVIDILQTDPENPCTPGETEELKNEHNPGIMSYGPEQESWYDTGTQNLIHNAKPPKP